MKELADQQVAEKRAVAESKRQRQAERGEAARREREQEARDTRGAHWLYLSALCMFAGRMMRVLDLRHELVRAYLFLVPYLRRKVVVRRRRRLCDKLLEQSTHERPSAEELLSEPLFAHWPLEVRERVVAALKLQVALPEQDLQSDGASAAAAFYISEGSVGFYYATPDITPKSERVESVDCLGWRRTLTTRKPERSGSASAGSWVGLEAVALNAANATIRSDGNCVLWVLPREALQGILGDQPELLRTMQQTARERVEREIPPLTPQLLRDSFPMFEDWEDVQLRAMLAKARPRYFAPGEAIIEHGEKPTHTYFLRSGAFSLEVPCTHFEPVHDTDSDDGPTSPCSLGDLLPPHLQGLTSPAKRRESLASARSAPRSPGGAQYALPGRQPSDPGRRGSRPARPPVRRGEVAAHLASSRTPSELGRLLSAAEAGGAPARAKVLRSAIRKLPLPAMHVCRGYTDTTLEPVEDSVSAPAVLGLRAVVLRTTERYATARARRPCRAWEIGTQDLHGDFLFKPELVMSLGRAASAQAAKHVAPFHGELLHLALARLSGGVAVAWQGVPRLAAQAEPRVYNKQSEIATEGEACPGALLVTKGRADLLLPTGSRAIGPGAVLGLDCEALVGAPWRAPVRVTRDVEAWFLPQKALAQFMMRQPKEVRETVRGVLRKALADAALGWKQGAEGRAQHDADEILLSCDYDAGTDATLASPVPADADAGTSPAAKWRRQESVSKRSAAGTQSPAGGGRRKSAAMRSPPEFQLHSPQRSAVSRRRSSGAPLRKRNQSLPAAPSPQEPQQRRRSRRGPLELAQGPSRSPSPSPRPRRSHTFGGGSEPAASIEEAHARAAANTMTTQKMASLRRASMAAALEPLGADVLTASRTSVRMTPPGSPRDSVSRPGSVPRTPPSESGAFGEFQLRGRGPGGRRSTGAGADRQAAGRSSAAGTGSSPQSPQSPKQNRPAPQAGGPRRKSLAEAGVRGPRALYQGQVARDIARYATDGGESPERETSRVDFEEAVRRRRSTMCLQEPDDPSPASMEEVEERERAEAQRGHRGRRSTMAASLTQELQQHKQDRTAAIARWQVPQDDAASGGTSGSPAGHYRQSASPLQWEGGLRQESLFCQEKETDKEKEQRRSRPLLTVLTSSPRPVGTLLSPGYYRGEPTSGRYRSPIQSPKCGRASPSPSARSTRVARSTRSTRTAQQSVGTSRSQSPFGVLPRLHTSARHPERAPPGLRPDSTRGAATPQSRMGIVATLREARRILEEQEITASQPPLLSPAPQEQPSRFGGSLSPATTVSLRPGPPGWHIRAPPPSLLDAASSTHPRRFSLPPASASEGCDFAARSAAGSSLHDAELEHAVDLLAARALASPRRPRDSLPPRGAAVALLPRPPRLAPEPVTAAAAAGRSGAKEALKSVAVHRCTPGGWARPAPPVRPRPPLAYHAACRARARGEVARAAVGEAFAAKAGARAGGSPENRRRAVARVAAARLAAAL
eukprot:TRINITY_DN8650_c1_g2_i1.p1 TRINITY_DN8650_c1_g2~~TRINITY_DN8650_c1_g2_i1.p1  ORF type:complete len:1489 (+),score=337.11 TRINITY_DN8650_c1_g2_i1:419-4885(+)